MSVINGPVGSPVYGGCRTRGGPPSGASESATASVAVSLQQGVAPEAPPLPAECGAQAQSGDKKKGGLFGTGFLSGLFGADSPMLNMVHSILDPIPVVGDIANKICGVVSPAYHEQHQAEQQPQPASPPPTQASLSLAFSATSSTEEDPSVNAYL